MFISNENNDYFIFTVPWYIRQLTAIIKKFKFQELESTVIPLFPETSWNAIKSRLSHHHEAFTASNVKKIIEQAIIVSLLL